MACYVVGEFEITNDTAMEPYALAVNDIIVKHGGQFLVRRGSTKLIEGGPEPKTLVILEFPDAAAIDRWYNSPDFQKILPYRLKNATGRLFPVEGVKAT